MSAESNLLLTFDKKSLTGNISVEDFIFKHPSCPDLSFYYAGIPGYARHFSRDALYTGLMAEDSVILKNTLRVAAKTQAREKNARTGAREGAIVHEYDPQTGDGIELVAGKTTLYNASDTAALFLIGHEKYLKLTGDNSLLEEQKENIGLAVKFIENQLTESFVFCEDPAFCGADRYALAVTSWKDSKLPFRKDGLPVGSTVIPLLHFQNLAGIRSAANLLGSDDLFKLAEDMRIGGLALFDKKLGNFPIAIDSLGEIKGISSDGLHALYFLEPGDLPDNILSSIIDSSKELETDIGYRVLDSKTAKQVDNDDYHAETVWHHEQAVIQLGAIKFYEWANENQKGELITKIGHVIDVSSRNDSILEDTNKYMEISYVSENGEYIRQTENGNNYQFWVWGAKIAKNRVKKQVF